MGDFVRHWLIMFTMLCSLGFLGMGLWIIIKAVLYTAPIISTVLMVAFAFISTVWAIKNSHQKVTD